VIAAAQAGQHNEKRHSYGHALIVDPWGKVIAQLEVWPLTPISMSLALRTRLGSRAKADCTRFPCKRASTALWYCTHSDSLPGESLPPANRPTRVLMYVVSQALGGGVWFTAQRAASIRASAVRLVGQAVGLRGCGDCEDAAV
jgi:hypothetical protein